ncbi:hypothetical protein MMC11_006860 [Xylographa trunciseda]|nr:hypothetical protein [Xylographa trunciseda]
MGSDSNGLASVAKEAKGKNSLARKGKKAAERAAERAAKKAAKKAAKTQSGPNSSSLLRPADVHTDSSSGQEVSDHGDEGGTRPDGPQGETLLQRRRRIAAADLEKDWVVHRNTKGRPLPPLEARGLYNPTGRVCYMNSVLQCLFHVPVFAQWIRFHFNHGTCAVTNCVACAINQLIRRYWCENAYFYEPFNQSLKDLHLTLLRLGTEISAEQLDAHDLYIFMATQLRQQLPRRTLYYECCSYSSANDVDEFSLSVNVPEEASEPLGLQALIRLSMKERVGARCDVCDENHLNRRCLINIAAAPDILVIQLRRFSFNKETLRSKKITQIVKFEQHLDMSRYYLPNKPIRHQSLRYELLGVVNHSGTLARGHYTAIVREPDKTAAPATRTDKKRKREQESSVASDSANETWKLASDTMVAKSSFARTEQKVTQARAFIPYMLFYKRY